MYNFKDWINESFTYKDFLEGTDLIIKIDTQEEYWEVMHFLEKMGYTWNERPATSENYFPNYKYFTIHIDTEKFISFGYWNWYKRQFMYSVIKTINKDMSDIDKARIIAKIINAD